jgi:hypothetical protein
MLAFVEGRERIYLEHFRNDFIARVSFTWPPRYFAVCSRLLHQS